MRRRELLAGAGGIALVGVAGCLDAVGMAEHEAAPAGVDATTRDETGYEETGIEPLVITEEAFGSEITVTNYLTEHEKTVSLGPLGEQRAAVFMVLTTPRISIVGRDFNPVEEMSAEELVEMVEDNYDEIGNITHVEDGDVTVLDQETTQSRFEADAQFDGQDVPVYIHVSEAVNTEDDHLVSIGVYPQELRDDEEENVLALMENAIEEADGEPDSPENDDDSDDTDDDEDDGTDGDSDDTDDDGDDGTDGGSDDTDDDGDGDADDEDGDSDDGDSDDEDDGVGI